MVMWSGHSGIAGAHVTANRGSEPAEEIARKLDLLARLHKKCQLPCAKEKLDKRSSVMQGSSVQVNHPPL